MSLRSALGGMGKWTIEIIKRPDKAKGFEVLPRRWVSSEPSHARALPTARQRLGKVHRLIDRLGSHRFNPHAHAQNRKILSNLTNF